MFDQESGSEPPLPDSVPDELVAQYGAQARKTVRTSRTWRYPMSRRVHRAGSVVRQGDLWVLTLMVFAWSVVGAGAIGALIYAAIAFPWAGMYVVLPVVVLFVLSFGISWRITRRRPHVPELD
jgi:hypothetical protein